MRTALLTIFALLMASGVHAAQPVCELQVADLTLPLRSTNGSPAVLSSVRYGTGIERIRRYTLAYSEGSLIVVEQFGCGGTGMRVSILSMQHMPALLELNRVAGVFKATAFWRSNFGEMDLAPLLQQELGSDDFQTRIERSSNFSYDASERIASPSAKNSTSIGFMKGNPGTQFRSILTLTIAME